MGPRGKQSTVGSCAPTECIPSQLFSFIKSTGCGQLRLFVIESKRVIDRVDYTAGDSTGRDPDRAYYCDYLPI